MNDSRNNIDRKRVTISVGLTVVILAVAMIFYLVAILTSLSSQIVMTIEIILLAFTSGISIYTLMANWKVREKLDEDAYTRMTILARASRDMRTPMNAIVNYSDDSMMDHYNPKQVKEAFKEINVSGKYMVTLIDDLLALCNVKEKRFTLNEKPHTIIETIETAANMSRKRFEEKQISFDVSYEHVDKFRYVLVDEVRIQQIIMNILANASKFTPNNGHVSLKVVGEDHGDAITVHIHIKDDGVGMSEAKVAKILSADPKDIGLEGTGMGMAIVNQLMGLLHGKITCHSKVNEGTEFIVTLNWKYTHKNNEQDMLDYSVLRGKNILLVENNMLNAEITRNILSNQGMMMDLASDGKQGVAMFTHAMPHTYDAILMDIRMPVMDGLEATSRIRHSTHPEAEIIPIIAMTADAFDEDRKKTADAGMNAHITKPIDPEELYITLTNYLHH